MPHVSRKRVKKDIFKRMSNEFIENIASLKNSSEIRGFLNELLTPTERIMLAKRMAAILMLKKGIPFRIVIRTLKLSPSTVSRFWKLTKIKDFQFVSKLSRKKQERKKFWDELEILLRAGMPPRGRGRWANVYKILGDNK
ncbi:TPA: hypothetical protein DEB04_02750 [Candidatus Giovannonibacteria bacterium]|nr:MAG: hypothetical protein UY62_C0048G0005 [Parcubacteria group bacterium GW2011_GWF2_50_9]HBT81612.1 hypothetical protein [Candidatus Giovannonibacteria bacterium]